MEDVLIRRSDAIKAVDRILEALWEIDIPSPTVPEYIEHHQGVQAVIKRAKDLKEILEKLPAARQELPWIPCDKKLPDYGYVVLVSLYDTTEVAHRVAPTHGPGLNGEKDCWIGWDGYEIEPEDVYAWMPLPRAYDPEGGGGA